MCLLAVFCAYTFCLICYCDITAIKRYIKSPCEIIFKKFKLYEIFCYAVSLCEQINNVTIILFADLLFCTLGIALHEYGVVHDRW